MSKNLVKYPFSSPELTRHLYRIAYENSKVHFSLITWKTKTKKRKWRDFFTSLIFFFFLPTQVANSTNTVRLVTHGGVILLLLVSMTNLSVWWTNTVNTHWISMVHKCLYVSNFSSRWNYFSLCSVSFVLFRGIYYITPHYYSLSGKLVTALIRELRRSQLIHKRHGWPRRNGSGTLFTRQMQIITQTNVKPSRTRTEFSWKCLSKNLLRF